MNLHEYVKEVLKQTKQKNLRWIKLGNDPNIDFYMVYRQKIEEREGLYPQIEKDKAEDAIWFAYGPKSNESVTVEMRNDELSLALQELLKLVRIGIKKI